MDMGMSWKAPRKAIPVSAITEIAATPTLSSMVRLGSPRATITNANVSIMNVPPGMMPPHGNGATRMNTSRRMKARSRIVAEKVNGVLALPSDTLLKRPAVTCACCTAASVSRR